MTRHHSCRVSPFGHPRIHARLAAPRGISQPPTSFIGSQCQGIHHAPLNTYNDNYKPIWKNCTSTNKNHTPSPKAGGTPLLARCSQPLSTNQTPHPTTKAGRQHAPRSRSLRRTGLLSQSPIVCPMTFRRPAPPKEGRPLKTGEFVVHQNQPPLQGRPIQRIAALSEPPPSVGGAQSRGAP